MSHNIPNVYRDNGAVGALLDELKWKSLRLIKKSWCDEVNSMMLSNCLNMPLCIYCGIADR